MFYEDGRYANAWCNVDADSDDDDDDDDDHDDDDDDDDYDDDSYELLSLAWIQNRSLSF